MLARLVAGLSVMRKKLKENFRGVGFCLSFSCASDNSVRDKPVMYVYDLFEEVE
jgi:hypothetical protein